MENPVRFALIGLALSLLALLPAFYMAYRLSKKQQKQGELAAFNAEVDKNRQQKKTQRKAKASEKARRGS